MVEPNKKMAMKQALTVNNDIIRDQLIVFGRYLSREDIQKL